MTECDTANSQNTTIEMTLSGPTNTVVTQSLSPNVETIVEGQVVHTTSTFILTVQFGTQGQSCRKILQDVAIYYEKCQTYCTSNDCPNTQPYFKHPTESRCVTDCPDGYTESGNLCVSTELCHSTCGTCSVKNNQTKCSTCSSTLTSLVYNTLTPPGSCSLPATNNAQSLMTVNRNTVLGTSSLKNITYNSGTQSTSGTVLSALPQFYT